MTTLLGATILYLIPAVLAGVFWFGPIKQLIGLWTGRDVMLSLVPERRHVHHTEWVLAVSRPQPRTVFALFGARVAAARAETETADGSTETDGGRFGGSDHE